MTRVHGKRLRTMVPAQREGKLCYNFGQKVGLPGYAGGCASQYSPSDIINIRGSKAQRASHRDWCEDSEIDSGRRGLGRKKP